MPGLVIGDLDNNERGLLNDRPMMPLIEVATTAIAIYISDPEHSDPRQHLAEIETINPEINKLWSNLCRGIQKSKGFFGHTELTMIYKALLTGDWNEVASNYRGEPSLDKIREMTFSGLNWEPNTSKFGAAFNTKNNKVYMSPKYLVNNWISSPLVLSALGLLMPDFRDTARALNTFSKSTLTHEYSHAISNLPN